VTEVDQLETLFPTTAPRELLLTSVRGADHKPVVVEVRPIRVGQLAAFMRALNGLLPAFADPENINVGRLVMDHTDQMTDAIAVALDVERELIERLDLADMVSAVAAVVEVNADFFTQRLLPALERAAVKVKTAVGLTSASA